MMIKYLSAGKDLIQVFLIVMIAALCSREANAQNSGTTVSSMEDGWIEKENEQISLDVSMNNAYEKFEVWTSDKKIILHPNTPANLRLKFNYRFLSLGLQFSPGFLPGNGDEDLKGKTKSFSLKTSFVFPHWYSDLSYADVEGYYLENTDDWTSRAAGDPFIQFPDLIYKGIDFSSGYNSNSRFSLRSLRSHTERQLRSAGSFNPVFNVRYYIIDDRSSDTGTQKTNNLEASIGPGYSYTFVVREKFYCSLAVMASYGYLNTRLTTRLPAGDYVTTQDNFILRWDGRTGLGYNGSRFYTGLYANVSGTKYKQENTSVMNVETRVFYHLFLGIRIRPPAFLVRQMNKI